jgi:hypothetical protein
MRSTPYCSTRSSVSRLTPAAPRFAFTRRHASHRTSRLWIRSSRAWKRRSGDRLAATQSRRCNWRTCRRPDGHRRNWTRTWRACSRASCALDVPTAGTLRSPRVLRRAARHYYDPLGFPLAPRSFSPSAYRSRAAPTRAGPTGLSCSVPVPVRVLCPVPGRDLPPVPLRTETQETWPSPRHDRLGSRIVNLSRLQASRDVAARGLAPSVEALDTPLGPPGSLPMPGVCYSALRRLPRRTCTRCSRTTGRPRLAQSSSRRDMPGV